MEREVPFAAKGKSEKMWSVYIHRNKINGKRYVGITSNIPEKRWGNGGNQYKRNSHFWGAICLYGWDNFSHYIILRNETFEYACLVEKCLIRHYKTKDPNHGYNMTDGGEGMCGFTPSEETRAKLRERSRGENNPNYGNHKLAGKNHFLYGKKRSEDTKKKISNTRKIKDYSGSKSPNWGKKLSSETRQKIKENHADFRGENSVWYGRKHTEESKRKMSESKKGKRTGVEHSNFKPIYCIELDQIFWGASAISSISHANITGCCRGKVKSAGKHPVTNEKLHWLYVEDQHDQNGRIIRGAITLGYITTDQLNKYIKELKMNLQTYNDVKKEECKT